MRTARPLSLAACSMRAIPGAPALTPPPVCIVGSITVTDLEAYNRDYGTRVPALSGIRPNIGR
jgi:hypothetical protein